MSTKTEFESDEYFDGDYRDHEVDPVITFLEQFQDELTTNTTKAILDDLGYNFDEVMEALR